MYYTIYMIFENINPLNPELNPICHLLAVLEARHILHVSRTRVYIYIYINFNLVLVEE